MILDKTIVVKLLNDSGKVKKKIETTTPSSPSQVTSQSSKNENEDIKFIVSEELKHTRVCPHCKKQLENYLEEFDKDQKKKNENNEKEGLS